MESSDVTLLFVIVTSDECESKKTAFELKAQFSRIVASKRKAKMLVLYSTIETFRWIKTWFTKEETTQPSGRCKARKRGNSLYLKLSG